MAKPASSAVARTADDVRFVSAAVAAGIYLLRIVRQSFVRPDFVATTHVLNSLRQNITAVFRRSPHSPNALFFITRERTRTPTQGKIASGFSTQGVFTRSHVFTFKLFEGNFSNCCCRTKACRLSFLPVCCPNPTLTLAAVLHPQIPDPTPFENHSTHENITYLTRTYIPRPGFARLTPSLNSFYAWIRIAAETWTLLL